MTEKDGPPIVDAEFEVISGPLPALAPEVSPRAETFGEREAREFNELSLLGKLIQIAVIAGLMAGLAAIIRPIVRGLVGWLWP